MRCNGFVKQLVGREKGVFVAQFGMDFLQFQFAFERAAEVAVVVQFDRPPDQGQFEGFAHELRFPEGRGSHRCNDSAALRNDIEKTKACQLLKRFANQRSADAKIFRELRFRQLFACHSDHFQNEYSILVCYLLYKSQKKRK